MTRGEGRVSKGKPRPDHKGAEPYVALQVFGTTLLTPIPLELERPNLAW